ncbi:L,D-transpeptidase [Patescibacteria group bacterium]|nr:L,D-transpeptidase [Patescibacteria group bacterium]
MSGLFIIVEMRKKHLLYLLPILFLGSLILFISARQVRVDEMRVIDLDGLTGEYSHVEKLAYFNNQEIKVPDLSGLQQPLQVLGNTRSYKWIEINLTDQHLYAYEDGRKVFDFLISTGKYGRTPTGVFRIWSKFKYTKMEGGSKELGNYYYLPNVPYTMFFYNDKVAQHIGYAVHGTYWHDNFGHPMSHGCINMKTEEAEQLYYWASPDLQGKPSIRATEDNQGTLIYIYGEALWE